MNPTASPATVTLTCDADLWTSTIEIQVVDNAKGDGVAHSPNCRHIKAARTRGTKVYEVARTIVRDVWGGDTLRDYPKAAEVAECLYNRMNVDASYYAKAGE